MRTRTSARVAARIYEQERLLLWMQERLAEAVERSGKRRADIAREAGVVKSCVTTALNSGSNLTLRTAAAIAHAAGYRIVLDLYELPIEDAAASGPVKEGT